MSLFHNPLFRACFPVLLHQRRLVGLVLFDLTVLADLAGLRPASLVCLGAEALAPIPVGWPLLPLMFRAYRLGNPRERRCMAAALKLLSESIWRLTSILSPSR